MTLLALAVSKLYRREQALRSVARTARTVPTSGGGPFGKSSVDGDFAWRSIDKTTAPGRACRTWMVPSSICEWNTIPWPLSR